MASINVRRGKLVIDFRYLGMRCREQTVLPDTPANRKQLNELANKMEAEITLGIFDYAKYFPKSKRLEEVAELRDRKIAATSRCPNFSAFSEVWYEEKKIEWKTTYQRKVTTTLNKYLKPHFGGQVVKKITKSDLLDFRASLAKVQFENQKCLSASRINQIMIPLRMILEESAERYGFETPYKNIRNLKEVKTVVHPLSLTDVWRFINSVRMDFRNYYIVRFFTGMRTSEIDGLRWRNVDLDKRLIRVVEALVDGKTETTKTTSSVRNIHISDRVFEALQHQYQLSARHSEYVFCDSKGGPLNYRNVNRRVWHPTLMILGLEPRRAYETRHTAATLWLAAGENPEWIARQLGHSNTEMLFRVYSHYVPDLTRRDGSAFEALLQQSARELEVTNEDE
ncbi:Arm DNA-binding domain-containing protein [Marinospirillum insulare]|uniref:Integrase n=1 Tax=Marinospirillum insulare TaxID=217169 RepID=A0ABQ5ZTK6_9GAMM|nr:DUF3596 domain-containing protein [Marinospirillum insulare]GLR62573.1 integrase [Marinospirillum insulare]